MSFANRFSETLGAIEEERRCLDEGLKDHFDVFARGLCAVVALVFIVSCLRVGAPPVETFLGAVAVGVALYLALIAGFRLIGGQPIVPRPRVRSRAGAASADPPSCAPARSRRVPGTRARIRSGRT